MTKTKHTKTDLIKLARMADSWRALGRTSEADEIDRAVAELQILRKIREGSDA